MPKSNRKTRTLTIGSAAAVAVTAMEPAALGGVTTLRDFLATAGQLTESQQQQIVDQALILLREFYVHLPLKRAMHAVEPLQRLRLLRRRLSTMSERRFHDEMIDIFTELRDLHTNYVLPFPYRGKTAFLPFLLEEFFEGNVRRFVVSKLIAGFAHASFNAGVAVNSWNGIPIQRAVELNAELNAGSNSDARLARGLEAMTVRPMAMNLPPDEEFVLIGYTDLANQDQEIRLDWRVFTPDPSPTGVDPMDMGGGATALGIDFLTEDVRRAKKALFAPKAMAAERAAATSQIDLAETSTLPDVFAFKTVTTSSGTFGYLRIWTFSVDDADVFIEEARRILGLLPQNGLIVDVRGNGGGLILAGERLLQLLTPQQIEPERLHFLNTALTLQLVEAHNFLSQWLPTMRQALETGADFSQGFPVEPVQNSNGIGQTYHGPVVLITDALCYSTTDIFAAGFQDHGIGPILGVSGNTGAGGANVWDHSLLRQLFPPAGSPLKPLPNGASMRVAIRRTTRVGAMSGVPLEDLGVKPDQLHKMTRDDLFEDNKDLINRAGQLLAQRKARTLSCEVVTIGAQKKLEVTTKNVDRLDIYLDGRPHITLDVSDGLRQVDLPSGLSSNSTARLEGYELGTLVAANRVPV
jgi:hypothetical protein